MICSAGPSAPLTILERTLEPDSSDEEPPPVYSPPAYDMHIYDRKYPEAPPTPPPRFEAEPPPGHQQVRSYRNWNPPLLGNLPDDFLRILPQQLDSIKSSQSSLSQPSSSSSSSVSSISQWTAQSGSRSGAEGTTGGPSLTTGTTSEHDKKLKQYLEDERIALFLQNEEFMRELQRNREFLIALERDRLKYESKKSKSNHSSSMENSTGEQYSAASVEAVSDDALFRDKLKHMGKSTRKKLFEIARTFSEKTKRRKSKRRTLLKHHSLGTANSTANLLDNVEGNPCEEAGQSSRANTQEENEQRNEPISCFYPGRRKDSCRTGSCVPQVFLTQLGLR
ncbi:CUE domain-containing protein 1b isoform 3-T3 [Acanthopagrus schlegelii]